MGQRGRPRHPEVLTPREQEVLSLIREGLTNEQIAGRLGIGFETAKTHVSQIIAKLGVETREEAATWREEERRWWSALPRWALIGTSGAALAAVALLALGVWLADGSDDADSVLITTTPSPTDTAPPSPTSTPPPASFIDVFADLPPPITQTEMRSVDDASITQGIYRYAPDGTLSKIAASDEPQMGAKFTYRMRMSPNRRWLAFTAGPTGSLPGDSQDVYLKDMQSGEPAVAIARFGRVWDLAVSPDARYIWVRASIAPYNGVTVGQDSYLIDLKSRTAKALFLGPLNDVNWSPDGQHVAYWILSTTGQTTVHLVYIADEDFSNPIHVSSDSGRLTWSPDSEELSLGGDDGLKMIQLDGTTETVNDIEIDPQKPMNWSIDGARLAYTTRVDAFPYRELVVRDKDGTEQRVSNATSGSWSPDGNSIAFEENGTVKTVDIRSGKIETYFETFQPLIDDHSWLPDASLVFTYSAWALESISVIRPDGTGLRHLAYGKRPLLSPDGQQITFTGQIQSAGYASSSTIFVMNLDGTGLTRLAQYNCNHIGPCTSPQWSADGTEIIYGGADGKQYAVASDGNSEPRLLGPRPTLQPVNVSVLSPTPEAIYSPDGTKVAYRDGPTPYDQRIFVAAANAPENAREITRGSSPQWILDGQWILFLR